MTSTLIELFCFGARRRKEEQVECQGHHHDDGYHGDSCCCDDDDDDRSEATEVTSNTSTYKEFEEASDPEVRLIESPDFDPAPVSFIRRESDTLSPAGTRRRDSPNNQRRRLPPRENNKSRFKALVVPSHTSSPRSAPASTPPKHSTNHGLPPRDETTRDFDNSRPTTSRDAIQNAVLVAQSPPPPRPSTTRPILDMVPMIRATSGRRTEAVETDDQSRGGFLSLFSKPSVIQVENDLEEDFEQFNEVQDDDQLCLDGSNDENDDIMNNHHYNSHHHQSSSGGASPTTTTTSSSSSGMMPLLPMALTEERVRAHLRDYYEDFDSIFRLGKSSSSAWESFFSQYFTPDIQWVRSSSNSLTGPELAEHFAQDIVGVGMKLVSIDSIQILALGLSAIVTFTADQKFVYRGTPNSDRTVITMVLTLDSTSGNNNGKEIRIAHEHRCTGKPIPDDAEWD